MDCAAGLHFTAHHCACSSIVGCSSLAASVITGQPSTHSSKNERGMHLANLYSASVSGLRGKTRTRVNSRQHGMFYAVKSSLLQGCRYCWPKWQRPARWLHGQDHRRTDVKVHPCRLAAREGHKLEALRSAQNGVSSLCCGRSKMQHTLTLTLK